ncbi:glycerol kinase GlpK [Humitalea sp. 24SJ18S-53]|uniref:glycerol kinase GlpK n=1 Tax=Humitalea sp. 24SJ18S-53 TaxID=3422307 RepID=UPI003D679576
MADTVVLALDQGTTSTRAMAFGADLAPRATARIALAQHFPASGWVEHAPEDLLAHSIATLKQVMAATEGATIAGLGLTNQRETTLLWDRTTGRALHRAIVWQDRRTAPLCDTLRAAGVASMIAQRTGLVLDPYFSATKLAWLLEEVPGARTAAEAGRLCFGTVDSWLLWHLTGGRVHATDATNAARTMLFDITTGTWDDDMLRLFRIPASVLPQVLDCAAEFGMTDASVLGRAIPIRGIAGDQQAATLGQACFLPGMVKSTYGTGGFALMVTGDAPVPSNNRLLTTIAWQIAGRRTYALEGTIFIAGAAVQWLRDGLGIINAAEEAGRLAAEADPAQSVILVPAFVGLGAPWWDSSARGAIFGLNRNTGPAEFCRAALESVAFQTRDLLLAMAADLNDAAARGGGTAMTPTVLRVDGGMSESDWTMQCLADILGAPVDRPVVQETTALGAAYLAAVQAGLQPAPGDVGAGAGWRLDRRFVPNLPAAEATRRHDRWTDAVRRTLGG